MTWIEKEKEAKPFVNVPPGPYAATCIDVVDMGVPDWTVSPNNPMGTPKVRIVFHIKATDENGNPLVHPEGQAWTASQTFSTFFGPKAFLRKFVEAWIGAVPKNERGYAIFDEDSLIGKDAYVNVVHRTAKDGVKVYANVESATRLLPGMKGPGLIPDYVRVKNRPAKQAWQKPSQPVDQEGIGF